MYEDISELVRIHQLGSGLVAAYEEVPYRKGLMTRNNPFHHLLFKIYHTSETGIC